MVLIARKSAQNIVGRNAVGKMASAISAVIRRIANMTGVIALLNFKLNTKDLRRTVKFLKVSQQRTSQLIFEVDKPNGGMKVNTKSHTQ